MREDRVEIRRSTEGEEGQEYLYLLSVGESGSPSALFFEVRISPDGLQEIPHNIQPLRRIS
jgi:hypothetical protein